MTDFPMPWPRSLWVETAQPPPPLDGRPARDISADAIIIGGGYTGLHAAFRFIERGLMPVVIEANAVGWGASGRNGGVVSTKYRVAIPTVAKMHGVDIARQMVRLGHEAVSVVEEAIESHSIEGADFRMNGNLRCAHNEVALASLKAEAEFMRDLLGSKAVQILSASEVAAETGSKDFVGGTLTPHSGMIHPLNYARGLARALVAEGGQIFEHTPALRLGRDNAGVIVETPAGPIRSQRVVIASNAYSDLTGATADISRTLIPFRSAMVATAPLPSSLRLTIMTQGRTYSETRRMMRWFRPFGDRMIFGGRGAFGKRDSEQAFASLHKAMLKLYPQLEGVAITHRWSGLVGLTLDSVPHVGRLDDRASYAVGYNGTGIATASQMGRHVADISLGENPDLALMHSASLKTVPFYGLREPAVRLVAGWYQFLDAIGR